MLYLKLLEQDTGAHVIAFTGNTEALEALRSGKCIAYLTDDTNVSFILSSGQWDGYEMPLQSKYVNYWSIGVPPRGAGWDVGTVHVGHDLPLARDGKARRVGKEMGPSPDEVV